MSLINHKYDQKFHLKNPPKISHGPSYSTVPPSDWLQLPARVPASLQRKAAIYSPGCG